MTNWNNPTTASTYANFVTEVNARDVSVVKMDPSGDTNIPTGALYLNTTTKRITKYNGTTFDISNIHERPLPAAVTTGGSANAYTAAMTPARASYVTGDVFRIIPHATNTGNSTLNTDSVGVLTFQYKGQNLVGGELVNSVEAIAFYDGTYLNLLNHGGGWATWTPTYGGTGLLTFGTVTTNLAAYQRHGNRVDFCLEASGTTGGTTNNGVTFTAPVSTAFTSGCFAAFIDDGGAKGGLSGWTSGTTIAVYRYDLTNWGLGASRVIRVNGFYRV